MPRVVNVMLLLCVLGSVFDTAALAITGAYEPNDTPQTAYGPLAGDTPLVAAIEQANNPDYYYFYAAGPGNVDVALNLASCLPTSTTSNACSNMTIAVASGGTPVGQVTANAAGSTQHVTFVADGRAQYLLKVTQVGAAGGTYGLSVSSSGGITSAAPDQPLPTVAAPTPVAPPPPLPSLLRTFRAKFSFSYLANARTHHVTSRRIRNVELDGLTKGSLVDVRCLKGCHPRLHTRQRVRDNQTTIKRGFPVRLSKGAKIQVAVSKAGTVGRWATFFFGSEVPGSHLYRKGCLRVGSLSSTVNCKTLTR